jgi:methanol---5-hydroxybenzimidazolylcobamide Co-methyltransferase
LRTRRAARATLALLRESSAASKFKSSKLEARWLDKLSRQADTLPEDEEEFIAKMKERMDTKKVRLSEYGIN